MYYKKIPIGPNDKGEDYTEKRKSFRVFPPLSAVTEVALWFKGFDSDEQISLSDLGMPSVVSVNKETRIVVEDISGAGIRLSLDRSALMLRGINRISDHMTVYLKLGTALRDKNDASSILVGVQLTGAFIRDARIVLRGKILVQARPDYAHNKLVFYNVEKAGIKDIHVLRLEITRMAKSIVPTIRKHVILNNLLIELMSDDDTQGDLREAIHEGKKNNIKKDVRDNN